jgi:hypothetical protein
MKSTDIIPIALIDLAERKRACSAALEWLRESPRTWQELTDYRTDWLEWAVRNLDLTSIPTGLTVGGDLNLFGCPALATLPEGLTVDRDLNLYHCPALATLPEGLAVGRDLYLYHCHTLATLPAGLAVGGSLFLYDCHATIPADINVRGKIYR